MWKCDSVWIPWDHIDSIMLYKVWRHWLTRHEMHRLPLLQAQFKTGHSKQCSVPSSSILMLQPTSNPAHSYLCVHLSNSFCLDSRLPVRVESNQPRFRSSLFCLTSSRCPILTFWRSFGCFYLLQWSPPRNQANLLSSIWMPDSKETLM